MIGITYLRFCGYFVDDSGWTMTLFPDYGLKAQGADGQGGNVRYRSIFQPYAGMYVVFWYVHVYWFYALENDVVGRSIFFILVSGLSVFWHFNGSDFVAACKYNTASRLRSHD